MKTKDKIKALVGLMSFIEAVEDTGGVVLQGDQYCPAVCPEWTDVGKVYIESCRAVNRKPLLTVKE